MIARRSVTDTSSRGMNTHTHGRRPHREGCPATSEREALQEHSRDVPAPNTRVTANTRMGSVAVEGGEVVQPRVVAEHLDRRGQRQAEGALEDAHLRVLVVLDERHRPSVPPGPGGAPGAVE